MEDFRLWVDVQLPENERTSAGDDTAVSTLVSPRAKLIIIIYSFTPRCAREPLLLATYLHGEIGIDYGIRGTRGT